MLEQIHDTAIIGRLFTNHVDVRHISANQMNSLTMKLFHQGKISLKERLAFAPISTGDRCIGCKEDGRARYFSPLWESPDRLIDMVAFFQTTLSLQFENSEPSSQINSTRCAIALLEFLDEQLPFNMRFS